MTEVDKRKILQILRDRGLHARAEWVDRQLPERVDLERTPGYSRPCISAHPNSPIRSHDGAQGRPTVVMCWATSLTAITLAGPPDPDGPRRSDRWGPDRQPGMRPPAARRLGVFWVR